MTETPAARHHLEQQAGSLTTGTHIVLPDGGRTAEVHQVELERDDFGAPALVLASLTGGGTLRIAVGTTVTVVDGNPDAVTQLPRAARPGQDSVQEAGRGSGQEQPRQLREEPAAAAPAPAVVVPPLPPVPPALSGPSEEDLALIPAPQGTPESVVEAAAEAHPDAMGVLLLSDGWRRASTSNPAAA